MSNSNSKESYLSFLLDSFERKDLRHLIRVANEFQILEGSDESFIQKIANYKSSKGWDYRIESSNDDRTRFTNLLLTVLPIVPENFSCLNEGCIKCKKLISWKLELREKFPEEEQNEIQEHVKYDWGFQLDLYDWQTEALYEWLEKERGVIKVVTGAGKTVLALSLIKTIAERHDYNNVRFFIVVPTIVLLEQWKTALMKLLGVKEKDIGIFYGLKKGNYISNLIQIYVINTAREILAQYNHTLKDKGMTTFLIADECHHYGSDKNQQIFQTEYDYTLGLSATPERQYDRRFEEIIVPALGEIIYNYTFIDALRDGIIPPFSITHCHINLTELEKNLYFEISENISKLQSKIEYWYPELKQNRYAYFDLLAYLAENESDHDKSERIEIFQKLIARRNRIKYTADQRFDAFNPTRT